MVAGEPWCFPPDVIAGMTDWQIEDLYLKPAVERVKRVQGGRDGTPEPTPEADAMPSRREFVGMATREGVPAAVAHAEYDRMLAAGVTSG